MVFETFSFIPIHFKQHYYKQHYHYIFSYLPGYPLSPFSPRCPIKPGSPGSPENPGGPLKPCYFKQCDIDNIKWRKKFETLVKTVVPIMCRSACIYDLYLNPLK